MAIVVSCPYCSNQAAVDEEYAGHQVQCPHCGGVMEVPAAAVAAPQPPYGNYYAPQAPQSGYVPGGYGAPPQPGWSGAPAAPSTFICASCGGMFVSAEGIDVDGHIYCQTCAPASAPAPVNAPGTAGGAPATHAPIDAPDFEVLERCDGCGGPFQSAELYEVKGKHLCANCAAKVTGQPIAAPAPITPVPLTPAATEHYEQHATDAAYDAGHPDEVASVPEGEAAYTPSYAARKKKTDYTGMLVGGGVLVAALVGGYILLTRTPTASEDPGKKTVASTQGAGSSTGSGPTTVPIVSPKMAEWEKKNGKDLRSLERLANAAVDKQDYAGADQMFQQIADLVKTAPGGLPADPGLQALATGAQRKWDAIKPNVPKAVAVSEDVKAQVTKLLDEADFVLKSGNKVTAFQRYRDLAALAKGSVLKGLDPALRKRVDDAAVARQALFDELRTRKDAFDVTASQLLETGYFALASGKWEAAYDTLYDVKLIADRRQKLNDRMKDDDLIRAVHGIAVAQIGSGSIPEDAPDMFDESQTLGILAKEKPTKELLWNRGVLDIANGGRASRTVDGVVAFMTKQEGTVDEELLNLLGTAIATAFVTPGANLPELYKSAAFYKTKNEQLEATRPGQMHWGVTWLPGAEGAALKAKKEAADKAFALKKKEVDAVKEKLEVVKKGERTAIKRGKSTIYVTRVNEEQLKTVNAELDAKVKEANAARDQIPKPSWLKEIRPMIPGTGVVYSEKSAPPPSSNPSDAPRLVRYSAAFPIDRYRLLTAAAPLGDLKQVRLEDMDGKVLTAKLVTKNEKLALLEVSPGEAGRGLKYFNIAIGYSGGPIKCATVPVASAFGPAPEEVKAVDPKRPPNSGVWELQLEDHPRLAGAPLLDESNRLVGVELARKDQSKDKVPSVSLLELNDFLSKAQALPDDETDKPAEPDGIFLIGIDLGT